MRKVLRNTSECAHVWANMSQAEGRAGNVHFDGATFYSYWTAVAKLFEKNGERFALLSNHQYSVSTNGQHIPAARSAIRGTPFAYVRIVEPGCAIDHDRNVRDMLERVAESEGKARRARKHGEYHIQDAARTFRELTAYTDFFGLTPIADRDATLARMDAEREVRGAERIAREAIEEALYAERHAKEEAEWLAKSADMLEQWLRGESVQMYRHPLTYLRVTKDGNEVETSRGAFVPIASARALWTAWNNGTLKTGERVGIYEYRESTPDQIVIGCHTITRAIADAFASNMGWAK